MALAHWSADRLPEVVEIRKRLERIFPAGTEHRAWLTADRAARSVFVFLYVFAVDGVSDNRLRPAMVTTMSDHQARKRTEVERRRWWTEACRPRPPRPIVGRWYAENTREPIRDETFRALKQYGAILEDPLPTTSARPRYRLARDFADLFDPSLTGRALANAIQRWQADHLPPAARARIALYERTETASRAQTVRFPDGSSRVLAAGPSTPLFKAAIEDFAPRFLYRPVVLVVSESRQRLLFEDRQQLDRIGLKPDARVMPDLLMADLTVPQRTLKLVLTECVATAGGMTAERAAACRAWLKREGFQGARIILGTVFRDRADAAFRAQVGHLAWGTFVWFATEPGNLLLLQKEGTFTPARSLDAVGETLA